VATGQTGEVTKPGVGPHRRALAASAALVVIGCLVGAFFPGGEDVFAPRVKTIDALAGLGVGAFFVDRLVTFLPVFAVRETPDERTADIDVLRLGYGALLGGLFVAITNLPAVGSLTAGKAGDVNGDADRAIAVLVIAGGVVGLSRILSRLNPKPKTDATKAPDPDAAAAATSGEPVPLPSPTARAIGYASVALAALAALLALGDTAGTELLAADKQADGTIALVVRFATVLVAAAIVEQIVERTAGTYAKAKRDKPLVTGAVSLVLGVLIARVMDLYLLHNLGFFGTTGDLDKGIEASKNIELWFDAFVTGAVIASGTKPLHDLSARLSRSPEAKPATRASAPDPQSPR